MGVCEHLPKVSAYHDGELSVEEARRLEAHLARCAHCARELNELRSLSHVLASAPLPPATPEVLQRLRSRLAEQGQVSLIPLAKRLIAAAAAIFILCALWLWGMTVRSEPDTKTEVSWELAAVNVRGETVGDAPQLAQWIVDELSSEPSHD